MSQRHEKNKYFLKKRRRQRRRQRQSRAAREQTKDGEEDEEEEECTITKCTVSHTNPRVCLWRARTAVPAGQEEGGCAEGLWESKQLGGEQAEPADGIGSWSGSTGGRKEGPDPLIG